ncbi:MAG TPA: hypothetical protein VG815_12350 [Chloroflexota bacterium]|jgi:predicted lipoprotein with Yx(FWY)xxD motif|nr:hypothetical protein [Chloroflexota bacterium]
MKIRKIVASPLVVLTILVAGSGLAMAGNPPAKGNVNLGSSKTLGSFLVTSKGLTLYHMLNENNGRFACTGKCLNHFHPYLLPKRDKLPKAGAGVVDTLAVVKRSGAKQITYDGWALYTFSGDKKAGMTNAQAKSKQWYVVPAQPTVTFNVAITSAGGTVPYGTVNLNWNYQKTAQTASCSSATCALTVNAGQSVSITQTPVQSNVAPFASWQYQPVHYASKKQPAAKNSTTATLGLKSRDDYTLNANYTAP